MNLRPPGYEPDELPGCSTPQSFIRSESVSERFALSNERGLNSSALGRGFGTFLGRCLSSDSTIFPATSTIRRIFVVVVVMAVVAKFGEIDECSYLEPGIRTAARRCMDLKYQKARSPSLWSYRLIQELRRSQACESHSCHGESRCPVRILLRRQRPATVRIRAIPPRESGPAARCRPGPASCEFAPPVRWRSRPSALPLAPPR